MSCAACEVYLLQSSGVRNGVIFCRS